MLAGRLRHLVSVRREAFTQSTITGELVNTWTTIIKYAWADIQPLSGREYYQSQQFQSKVDTKITLRHNSTVINPTMIIAHGTSIYNIESVIKPNKQKIEQQIMCFERLATNTTNAGYGD